MYLNHAHREGTEPAPALTTTPPASGQAPWMSQPPGLRLQTAMLCADDATLTRVDWPQETDGGETAVRHWCLKDGGKMV